MKPVTSEGFARFTRLVASGVFKPESFRPDKTLALSPLSSLNYGKAGSVTLKPLGSNEA